MNCILVFDGRLNDLNRRAFLTIKNNKPENLVFQQIPKKRKIIDAYRKYRLEEYKKMRNGRVIDTLTNIDRIERVKCGGIVLQLYEGFFCHNLECSPHTEFVTEKFRKRTFSKVQGKDLLQSSAKKKICLSVYGGIISKDVTEE